MTTTTIKCYECDGTGRFDLLTHETTCDQCHGTGTTAGVDEDGFPTDLTVPGAVRMSARVEGWDAAKVAAWVTVQRMGGAR